MESRATPSAPTNSPANSPANPTNRNRVSPFAIGVAAASTVVEWYDFTLYIYFATVISRVFFPGAKPILTTLGVFALSYLMRPLGAIFFGHLGDRHGRKPVLLVSMTLMSIAMGLTAILPTHAQWGMAAGALLMALRFLMAFSVGGEYNGVVTYLVEGAHPSRRGLLTSLAAAASEIGALLAVAVSAITVSLTTNTQLETWGWRIPFAIGSLLARSRIDESPDFLAAHQNQDTTTNKLPLWTALRKHPGPIIRTFAISALASVGYYVGITYVPTYLSTMDVVNEQSALWISTAAAVLVVAISPLMGWISDRVGRRPVLITTAVLSLVGSLLFFGMMGREGLTTTLIGAFALALISGGYNAVSGTTTAEQFPAAQRMSGLALGVTIATALFGGLTPYLAEKLTQTTGWTFAPGILVSVVALVVVPVVIRMPETAWRFTEGKTTHPSHSD